MSEESTKIEFKNRAQALLYSLQMMKDDLREKFYPADMDVVSVLNDVERVEESIWKLLVRIG